MPASPQSWITTAKSYWKAGLTPLPRSAGSVEPAYLTRSGEILSIPWGQYKVKQPDWETVEGWFTTTADAVQGITLLTGSHAHPRAQHAAFLQILDIETAEVFAQWTEELTFLGHTDILHRCVIERTPSGGAHIGFLCRTIGDTQKITLARRAADNKILVELLQHQPCTIAPTAGAWKPEHPANAAYVLTHGDWTHPYELSAEQRAQLVLCARAFNEVPDKVIDHTVAGEAGTRPGDLLNAAADSDWWRDLLERHDWREVSRPGLASRGVYYFQRPGKVGREPSATYGMTGTYLYVFSSNAMPFEPDSAYSAFTAYALLEHDGNFRAAAQRLHALSSPATPHTTPPSVLPEANSPPLPVLLTPEIVAQIEESMEFATTLVQVITAPVNGQGPHWLFEPVILARLQRLAHDYPGLYQGMVLPKARALHIWVPEITQAMEGMRPPFDPFVFTDAASILATTYPPQRWLISGLIADGLTILGGSPKSGKSYLAYALALAVCRPALWCQEWVVDEGPVTFVSLEDDESDSAQRLRELCPGLTLQAGRLRFVHGVDHVPSFSEGFLGWVEDILKTHQPRLMVIDPISYLYVLKRNGNQFEETKDMLFPLRWLGKHYCCAIVCVDHRRKRSKDDVSIFDTLHGSVAKIAVADGLLMVDRDETEITVAALIRRGKDQTLNLSLEFDEEGAATLMAKGTSTQSTQYGDLRRRVLELLAEIRTPLAIPEIIAGCELVDNRQMRGAINQILIRGQRSHEIHKTTRGSYVWAGGA